MFEGLEVVQESAETNMLDYQAARSIATCMGSLRPGCGLMSTGTNTSRVCFAGSLPLSKDSPPLKKQTVAVTARHSETASCPRIGPKSMGLPCEKLLKTRSEKPLRPVRPHKATVF